MSLNVVLFLHIVSALVLFAALGLELAVLRGLLRASTAQIALAWLSTIRTLRVAYPAAFVGLLLSGVAMIGLGDAPQPWTGIALASMVGLALTGGLVTGRRMPAIRRAVGMAAQTDPTARPPVIEGIGLLWSSAVLRLGLALAIVFVMTVKPDLVGSVVTVALGIVAGVTVAAARPVRPQPTAAPEGAR
jgi:hypothetical protein